MFQLINLLSLLKWFYETLAAGYRFFVKKKEEQKIEEAQELKKDIEHAETEEDFRDAANRLSKLGDSKLP